MSPDSPVQSRSRRAWRAMSAFGCILGAASILLTAVKWTNTDDRQDRQTRVATQAICAVVAYAEDASDRSKAAAVRAPNPYVRDRSLAASASLDQLAGSMRRTRIACPPRKPAK